MFRLLPRYSFCLYLGFHFPQTKGEVMMLVILEGLVMCFVLLLICVVLIRNGAVGGVVFYEDDVKKRVVELGYTTEKTITRNYAITSAALFIPIFTVVPYMVYGINGAEGFWSGFWQMAAILWIMGLFDRLFIDWFWVEHTKAWIIPGTEDLMPYIPFKTKIGKWLGTVVGFPVIAALVAGVVSFFG